MFMFCTFATIIGETICCAYTHPIEKIFIKYTIKLIIGSKGVYTPTIKNIFILDIILNK